MLVALALAPTTGLADAAALLGGSGPAAQSVARASHLKLVSPAALCKPGVVHPVANPRIVCPPRSAPPAPAASSGNGSGVPGSKGAGTSGGKGGHDGKRVEARRRPAELVTSRVAVLLGHRLLERRGQA